MGLQPASFRPRRNHDAYRLHILNRFWGSKEGRRGPKGVEELPSLKSSEARVSVNNTSK
jgi:hypothetical protein